MASTDSQLLERIAAGDMAAFGEFYDRHAPRVLGLLTRMLRSPADAEDVFQEVFWQVWSRAASYDFQRSAPVAWLIVLARSRALDFLRRRKRQMTSVEEIERVTLDDPSLGLQRDEAAQQVWSALQGIPADQRQAVEMSFFGGLTHEEIAEVLGVPLGTVKSRIRLGMKRLHSLLPSFNEVHPS